MRRSTFAVTPVPTLTRRGTAIGKEVIWQSCRSNASLTSLRWWSMPSSSAHRGIGSEVLRGLPLRDRAILVRTGWSRFRRTSAYFEPNPFLTGEACEILVGEGARFVGIDSLNIDDVDDLSRPAHTKLLGAGIPVCEHMTNLDAAPPSNSFLHAVPIAWVRGATFPVRAYVMTED